MIRAANFLFFLGLLVLTNSSLAHDYYVSITNIYLNHEEKSVQIEIKLTAHDVEKEIINLYHNDLRLGTEKELADANVILSEYFKKHFSVWINGEKSKLNYLGKEIKLDETLYIYLEGKMPKKIKNIHIKNTLLFSSFPLQQNVVHINEKGDLLSHTFTKNNTDKVFNFNQESAGN